MSNVKTQDPCYYCNGAGCGGCNPSLDTTPTGVVWYAAERLNAGGLAVVGDHRIAGLMADLLVTIADDMSDNGATEREFPDLPNQKYRWQVVDEHGKGWVEHTDWHEALKLARAILGRDDPNEAAGGAV